MPQPRESISCGWLSTRSDTVRNSGVCTRNRPCCGRRTLFDANGESGVCQAEQTQGPASVLAAIRCRSLAGLASVSVFIGCRRFGRAEPSRGSAIPASSPANRLRAGLVCQTPVSNRRGVLGPGPASVTVFIGCRRFGPARPSWDSAIPVTQAPNRLRAGFACQTPVSNRRGVLGQAQHRFPSPSAAVCPPRRDWPGRRKQQGPAPQR